MSGEVVLITAGQAAVITNYEEGHFGDVKAIAIAPAKMSESVSSFANTDGGDLYIGIDDDRANGQRRWRGFATPEDANAHLQVFERLISVWDEVRFHVPSESGRQ